MVAPWASLGPRGGFEAIIVAGVHFYLSEPSFAEVGAPRTVRIFLSACAIGKVGGSERKLLEFVGRDPLGALSGGRVRHACSVDPGLTKASESPDSLAGISICFDTLLSPFALLPPPQFRATEGGTQ